MVLRSSLDADLNESDNLEKLEQFVCNSLIRAADIAIPTFKNKTSSHKQLPSYVLDLIKARKSARKKLKKNPKCEPTRQLYNKLTKIIREENRAANNNE